MKAVAADRSRSEERSVWSRIGRAWIAVPIAAHGPLVATHLHHLWARPHYQFVAILLPLVVGLMWKRWPRGELHVASPRLERAVLGLSFLLLSLGTLLPSPYLGAVSAVLTVGFFILKFAGVRALGALMGPWLLLWFAVPPPLGYDLILVSSMQSLTSRLASLGLDLLAIDHVMAGNVLNVPGAAFLVDEACSGVHSLFALLGYTAVVAVFTRRRILQGIALLGASIGWAVLANVLRVSLIAVSHVWWQIDLSTGWQHDVLGFVTFVIALGLTLSTDRWLVFGGYLWQSAVALFRERWRKSSRAAGVPSVTAAERHRRRLEEQEAALAVGLRPRPRLGRFPVAAYGLLFLVGVSGLLHAKAQDRKPDPLQAATRAAMPESFESRKLTHFEIVRRDLSSDFGQTSLVWKYTGEADAVEVAWDGYFPGWHELTRCYRGQGWSTGSRRTVRHDGMSWVEVVLSKPTGEEAFLVFGLVTTGRRPVTPPGEHGIGRLIDRLTDQQSLQIQAFAEVEGGVDEALRGEVRNLFVMAMRHCVTMLQATNTAGQQQGGTNG